jgi:16S rRNA (guanine527-N7)-methyltransferase
MVGIEIILNYFPELSGKKLEQFSLLGDYYRLENEKVNLISRKDFENIYVNHVLHALAYVKCCPFLPGQNVLDIGTGGGFPGIPLAIYFPETEFVLCDSIGKKINAVNSIAEKLALENVLALNQRIENLPQRFDIAVARAVAPMAQMYHWMQNKWENKTHFSLLKGGDLTEEMNELLAINPKLKFKQHLLAKVFYEPFYETKKLIQITE